jgi:hypothetical protein
MTGISNYDSSQGYRTSWGNTKNAADGYSGLGYLFRNRIVKDGKAFYCPDMSISDYQYATYSVGWNALRQGVAPPLPAGVPTILQVGYLYRVHGDASNFMTTAELITLNNLKQGKPKGSYILVTEIPYCDSGMCWSHIKPWGLNVAYNDGHATFVVMTKAEWDAAMSLQQAKVRTDKFAYYTYLFPAMERGDMAAFTPLVMARDWTTCATRYPHFGS